MAVARKANEHPVTHALATHGRMVTNQWRHKIELQKYFDDKSTHALIDSLCQRAVREIDAVIAAEKLLTDQKNDNERDYFIKYLTETRDGFDGLVGAQRGESIQDREDSFNYILSELFDIGDMKIELRGGGLQKFLWVG